MILKRGNLIFMRAAADTTGGLWSSRYVQPDLLYQPSQAEHKAQHSQPGAGHLNPLEWSSLWLSSTIRLGRRSRGMGRTPQLRAYSDKILSTTYNKSKMWMGGEHSLGPEDKIILLFLQCSCLVCCLPDCGRIWAVKGSSRRGECCIWISTAEAPTLRWRRERGYQICLLFERGTKGLRVSWI